MRPHCILIVDDEPLIRSSLSRLFQREGCNSLLAENADDAWSLLRKREVSVIFSDHVMPGDTGLNFLRKVKQEYPHIVRMAMSGRADLSVVMAAIHEKVVSHFLLKPWDNEVMRKTLHQAIAHYDENIAPFHARPQSKEFKAQIENVYSGTLAILEAENGAIIVE